MRGHERFENRRGQGTDARAESDSSGLPVIGMSVDLSMPFLALDVRRTTLLCFEKSAKQAAHSRSALPRAAADSEFDRQWPARPSLPLDAFFCFGGTENALQRAALGVVNRLENQCRCRMGTVDLPKLRGWA